MACESVNCVMCSDRSLRVFWLVVDFWDISSMHQYMLVDTGFGL